MKGLDNKIFKTCPYCGMFHIGRCPALRSIEYYPDGTVKKIVYENGQSEDKEAQ